MFHPGIQCLVIFCTLIRSKHWIKASPWLSGRNPREQIMPVDGDDGVFPTTGNELVRVNLCI